jgi:hypothetical protein
MGATRWEWLPTFFVGLIKFFIATVAAALAVALGLTTYAILLGPGGAAEKGHLQALGTDILVPAFTAILTVAAALAGVKVVATAWYNVHRKANDPWRDIRPFDW